MTQDDLFKRYSIAYQEYRAEVTLGWDRMKTFLTINPTFTVLLAMNDKVTLPVRLAAIGAASIALAGALIVHRSHKRYKATQGPLQQLQRDLGIEDILTTGGQREAVGLARLEQYRIADVVTWVFVLIAALDLALATLG